MFNQYFILPQSHLGFTALETTVGLREVKKFAGGDRTEIQGLQQIHNSENEDDETVVGAQNFSKPVSFLDSIFPSVK